jgi:pyrroline-5-carboxylate reductase
MTQPLKVGFLGTGHIAAPMARLIARQGHTVTVSERSQETSSALAAAGLGIAVANNQSVLEACDVVFLCLRPGVWADVAAPLNWRANHRIISVMAGVSLAQIMQVCAPVTHVSATLPLEFLETGGCPLPVAGPDEPLRTLLGTINPIIPLDDEAQLQSYFAASALMSGVLGVMQSGAEWLGEATHNKGAGEVYVANLISGYLGALAKDEAGELEAHKNALASPNTLNRQMVEGLAEAGTFKALPEILGKIKASMT